MRYAELAPSRFNPALEAQEPDHDSDLLTDVKQVCQRAANGDLEARILNIDTETEIGQCCIAINHLLDIADAYVRESAAAMAASAAGEFHRPILLRGMPGAYRKSAVVINQAADKMRQSVEQNRTFEAERERVAVSVSRSAETVAESAGQVDTIATTINGDAERTYNMSDKVSHLAENTATNMAGVAAACEELNATTSEIARQTKESETLTRNAVTDAESADSTVHQLAEAGRKIQSVVDLIQKIAAQTNLLALNATIEAARAGEHGRGFAVVATEVKELARDTAKSTEEINAQVENIQQVTEGVAKSIAGIGTSIQQIDRNVEGISKSLNEQSLATSEIARNISGATTSTNEISENIREVSDAAAATRQAAEVLQSSSGNLNQEAATLRQEVAGLSS